MQAGKAGHRARVEAALRRVTQLIGCYLPLSNAHSNDFLTAGLWDSMLPQALADQLIALPSDRALIDMYMSSRSRLIDCCRPQFNRETDEEEEEEADGDLSFPSVFPDGRFNKSATPLWRHSSLESFVDACAACSLECLDVLTDVDSELPCLLRSLGLGASGEEKEEVEEEGEGERKDALTCQLQQHQQRYSQPFVSHAMGVKKSHEVERLSALCHRLSTDCRVEHLVDVGAGKGYLGACLNLAYGRSVLEIDASDSNSEGSRRRRANLKGKWRFLVRKAEGAELRLTPSEYQLERRPTPADDDEGGEAAACASVSAVVRDASHLTDIVRDNCACGGDAVNFGLTGLHTCGQLASTILQFFANSASRLLVNVGCCYNLLDEANCVNPFEPAASQTVAGFPLSDWLISTRPGFAIGRNARILASQSMERLGDSNDERQLHSSMYYRVLLQQLLMDRLGYTDDAWIVGKIGRRCHSFVDYVRLGLTRLGMQALSNSLSNDDIERYLSVYARDETRLFRFFLLRCLTAPAIEACILLDRLMFLLEQPDVLEARCCRVFDPKTSPRCYALLAFRR